MEFFYFYKLFFCFCHSNKLDSEKNYTMKPALEILPNKNTKHDIMCKIKYLCRNAMFEDAFKYSKNLIKYSSYAELIVIYGSLVIHFHKSLLKYISRLTTAECANLINQYGVDGDFTELNLHENSEKFLAIVLNVVVARLLVNNICSGAKLSMYLKIWFDKNIGTSDFEISLRKFIVMADMYAPRNLFIIFGTLHGYNFGSEYYLFVLKWEIIVRAITFKLNRFEAMKMKLQLDENYLLTEEKKLSKLYIQLTNFCGYNSAVQFEFLLTAFSLHPTEIVYNEIKQFRNNIRNDWIDEIFSGRIFNPAGRRVIHNDFVEQLGSDVLTILIEPRNKLIKSNLDWYTLDQNLCQLLNKQYKLNFVRNYKIDANLHLKYLNLDYSQFRELPQEICYEEYLDPVTSIDSDRDAQIVDSSNTIEVTNGRLYGFNRFINVSDIQVKKKLLPSVFIIPIRRSTKNLNNNFVNIKRPLAKTLKKGSDLLHKCEVKIKKRKKRS